MVQQSSHTCELEVVRGNGERSHTIYWLVVDDEATAVRRSKDVILEKENYKHNEADDGDKLWKFSNWEY